MNNDLHTLLGYVAANGDSQNLLDRIETACIADFGAKHLRQAMRDKGAPLGRIALKGYASDLGLTPAESASLMAYLNKATMQGTLVKTTSDAESLAQQIVQRIDRKAAVQAGAELMNQGRVEEAQTLLADYVDAGAVSDVKRATYKKLQSDHGIIAPTDIGAAQLFADRRGSDFIFVSEWKRWLRWDGKRWASVNDETIGRAVIDFCRFDLTDYATAIDDDAKRTDMMKFSVRCQSANAVNNVRALAATMLAVDASKLDADPNVINLRNGTLDLDALVLRPHRRDDYLTKIGGATYADDATVANGPLRGPVATDDSAWHCFLSKVIPDADVRDYLQRAVGYSLTASVAEEKLVLLFGGGRNGKTTFINAVRHVLGDYAMEGDQQLLTYKSAAMKGANSDATADLVGRRFVAVSETADGDRLDEAKVKALVSNKPINAMRKYERAFTFNPSHKLWIDTNHRPKVRGTDDGIWRRIAIVPFDVQIQVDDVDAKLREKLEAEADIIFRWALDGLRAYCAQGLTEPTAIRKATQGYRADSDTLRLFISECVGRDEAANVTKSVMFSAYRRWLDANGYSFNLTAPVFNQRLVELGLSEGRTASARFWRGRRLLDDETNEHGSYDREPIASPCDASDDDNRPF